MTVTMRVPPTFPRAAERGMAAMGLRYIRAWRKLIEPDLVRALEAARGDVDDPAETFRVGLASMLGYLSRTEEEIPPGAVITAAKVGRYGTIVTRQSEGQVRRILQLPSLTSVDPARRETGGVTPWATEASERIVLIQEDYRSRVRAIIEEGYERGQATERIAAKIQEVGAATENRARLWARDQIATINAEATEGAHARAGVTHYRWSTSRDERVRRGSKPGQNHVEREGVIYAWSRPPAESSIDGHPGKPINCRCVAIPIPPSELDDALAAQAQSGDLPPFAAT